MPQSRTPATQWTPIILLIGVVLVLLVPFVNSAFRIDDPLFIWAARHIRTDPMNPYAFTVNWYGSERPMSAITQNPPLASYYIALAASVLGWSEAALHTAFLLPALAVAIGTYQVARRFCQHPLLAALAAVLTPVFCVSSLTVMSDVLMLAFWVWAVHLWIIGIDTKHHWTLAAACLLIAMSSLTKYFGVALVPLLLVYTLLEERRLTSSLCYLLFPIVVLASYQWGTERLYGRGLLGAAVSFAGVEHRGFRTSLVRGGVTLAFTGGCMASALLLCRQLWSRRAIAVGLVGAAMVALMVFARTTLGLFTMPLDAGVHALVAVQMGVWAITGLSVVVLASLDINDRRDPDALFLFLWTLGTFTFAGFVNWSTNGRSVLPMIVPAGILMARRFERLAPMRRPGTLPATVVPLAAAALVSVAVTWADCRLADAARQGAIHIMRTSHQGAVATVWFQGHWGFQYYMEQLGARAADRGRSTLAPNDIVVVPSTNVNLYRMPAGSIRAREVIEIPSSGWLATMNMPLGAGFYAHAVGPLPFVVGSVEPERFTIFDVTRQAAK